jgi:hypothetical protein
LRLLLRPLPLLLLRLLLELLLLLQCRPIPQGQGRSRLWRAFCAPLPKRSFFASLALAYAR